MNLGAALAAIASHEAEAAALAASDPHRAHAWMVRREAEEQAARRWAALDKMEAYYQARRAQKNAAAQAAALNAATSGLGWRVLAAPRVSHAELDRFVREVWALGWHASPFPDGWRARWATLADAYGRVVRAPKLILLDAAAHRRRTPREFLATICHELVHVVHPAGETHGERFAETLRRVLAHVCPEAEALVDAAPATRPHPEPRKGILFGGRPANWPDAGGWEYR